MRLSSVTGQRGQRNLSPPRSAALTYLLTGQDGDPRSRAPGHACPRSRLNGSMSRASRDSFPRPPPFAFGIRTGRRGVREHRQPRSRQTPTSPLSRRQTEQTEPGSIREDDMLEQWACDLDAIADELDEVEHQAKQARTTAP